MHTLILSGIAIVCGSMIAALEYGRMARSAEQRKRLIQPVLSSEFEEDFGLELIIPGFGFVQQEPILKELQAAIKAADDAGFRVLLAITGVRHPDSMVLDRGLSPLLLAAYMHVRTEEHDRRLKEIMKALIQRGARVTQRSKWTGSTVMHLLACHPPHCCVMHRFRYLMTVLEKYRNCVGLIAPPAGLLFDPVLNGAPPAEGGGGAVSISVHPLGMRCSHGMLPEDLAPAGFRRDLLRERRLMLPPGLQGSAAQAAT